MTFRPQSRARRAMSSAREEPKAPAVAEPLDLFAPAPADDLAASDPIALTRTATLASGRAMKARLWHEAKALAALAESYARLGGRAGAQVGLEDPTEPGRQRALAFLRSVGAIRENGAGADADFSAS